MKYRLLLAGKNKSLINDFFMQMDTFFDCLTSSMRYADLLGHIKYLKPHAFVFCMNAENRDDTTTVISLYNTLKKADIPLVVVADSDDYSFFSKLPGSGADLTLLKPLTLVSIQDKLLAFLHQTIPQEKIDCASHDEITTETETTLNILSQLEQELGSLDTDAADTTEAAPKKESSEPQRIMIIDDAPGMLKAIKDHLGSDYEVATAISGKIALRYLQNKTVDMIFLDYAMPEMDGPEVYEKLLADPKTADIPVVFLTGVNDSEKIQKALSLKPKGYVLKPVDKETLLDKVHEVLG